jgi:hypothetical protein
MQRQYVVEQVLNATSLPEIESATQALDAWLAAHPDDLGMEDGYEQLALMRRAVEALDGQASCPVSSA